MWQISCSTKKKIHHYFAKYKKSLRLTSKLDNLFKSSRSSLLESFGSLAAEVVRLILFPSRCIQISLLNPPPANVELSFSFINTFSFHSLSSLRFLSVDSYCKRDNGNTGIRKVHAAVLFEKKNDFLSINFWRKNYSSSVAVKNFQKMQIMKMWVLRVSFFQKFWINTKCYQNILLGHASVITIFAGTH